MNIILFILCLDYLRNYKCDKIQFHCTDTGIKEKDTGMKGRGSQFDFIFYACYLRTRTFVNQF